MNNNILENCLKFIKDIFGIDNVKITFGGSDAYVEYETDTVVLPGEMPPSTVFGVLASLVGTLLHTDKEVMAKAQSNFESHLAMTVENYRVEKILRESYPVLKDYLDEANEHFSSRVDKMVDNLPITIQLILAVRKTLEGKEPILFEFAPVFEAIKLDVEKFRSAKSTAEVMEIVKAISETSRIEFYKLPPRIETDNGCPVHGTPATVH